MFATCLQEKASQCDALPIFLVDHWKLFEGTCTIVNVSRPAVLETQAAAAAPQMGEVLIKIILFEYCQI